MFRSFSILISCSGRSSAPLHSPDSHYHGGLCLAQTASPQYFQSAHIPAMEQRRQLPCSVSDPVGREQGRACGTVFTESAGECSDVLGLHIRSPLTTHSPRETSSPVSSIHGAPRWSFIPYIYCTSSMLKHVWKHKYFPLCYRCPQHSEQ